MEHADDQETRKHSPVFWIGGCIGCAVVAMIALGIAGWLGVRWVIETGEAAVVKFEEAGFVRDASGQLISVSQPLHQKTVFFCQMAKLQAPVHTDVAAVSQSLEIYDEVEGSVYFRGQMLTIGSQARIHGDLDVECQIIMIHGQVDGEVIGGFQQCTNADGTVTMGQSLPTFERGPGERPAAPTVTDATAEDAATPEPEPAKDE